MANKIEKILNITYRMGSANQNEKIPIYTIQMAVIKRERDTGEDVEKLGSLYTVDEKCNIV